MKEPKAVPKVPLPSMIPVTVEVAFWLPLSADYLPRSAAQAALIKLFKPEMKKPKRNIKKKKRAGCMSVTWKVNTNEIMIEVTMANIAIGDLFP